MDYIPFSVNGIHYKVGGEVDSDTTLNDYLRAYLNLNGTKYMCREGGCGACIVNVRTKDVVTGKPITFSVNSCLVSITQCFDWDITTVEGIGNRKDGYHPIQKTLAKYNGTQCGFCTPGWVMQMYSVLESNKNDMSTYDIENSFASNMCRCTGYRPILDAFKSFANDHPHSQKSTLEDIEDLTKHKCTKNCDGCNKVCKEFKDWQLVDKKDVTGLVSFKLKDEKNWFRVTETKQIFDILNKVGYKSYMLVSGNTAKGAYQIFEYPDNLIDISGVKELKQSILEQNFVLGAGTTLADTMEQFLKLSKTEDNFAYLSKLYQHLDLVAHIPVRNIGSIAGNLMTKYQHNDFSSDPFLLFETVGAKLTLLTKKMKTMEVSLTEFLRVDMSDKIILNVLLPPLSKDVLLVTYKIMPRAQNAHAEVNSGFLYRVHPKTKEVTDARIVYGGLSRKFVRAYDTEHFLIGRHLFVNETVQKGIQVLKGELYLEDLPPEPSPKFRGKLAINLFYKGLLHLCPPELLKPQNRSGGINQRYIRPVSSGKQSYDTNKNIWPVSEPMPKVEALIQCAGEAEYVDDLPHLPDEVYGAFVLAKVGRGEIDKMDPSEALSLHGVLKFLTHEDIPGNNTFISLNVPFFLSEEEILSNGKIRFYDQPIAIIVAKTYHLAERAAKLVHVTYKNCEEPVLELKEAKKKPERVQIFYESEARSRGTNIQKVIKGEDDMYQQYPYHMELQTTVTLPKEYGIEVNASTQTADLTQQVIAESLKLQKNEVPIKYPRCGGGYGARISRGCQISTACALVTYIMNKPCRFVTPIEVNMRAIGRRPANNRSFEVGVSSEGEIQYLNMEYYVDDGCIIDEPLFALGLGTIKNTYNRERWRFSVYDVITDHASHTYIRAPGSFEAISQTEILMERIAVELGLEPVDVRLRNITISNDRPAEMIRSLRSDAEYDKRKEEVRKFNKENRWKKRGISLVPMIFASIYLGPQEVMMTVFHGDGTICISHTGTEMGQGLNTKVIQACAYTLRLPMEMFRVVPYSSDVVNNNYFTGGSTTTDAILYGAVKCCQLLEDKLAPVRAQFPGGSWETVTEQAYLQGIMLQTSFKVNSSDITPTRPSGVTICEVEIDMLTGEFDILRLDLVEDVGLSYNPEIDIGQIEGALVMGIGYWTCERLYFYHTGELKSDRTWHYKIPSAKDIPIDFRVNLRQDSEDLEATLSSKAVSEPPLTMSVVVTFALREAITSSRLDSGYKDKEWFKIEYPYTGEHMVLGAETKFEEYLLN